MHTSDRLTITAPSDLVAQANSSAPVYGWYPFSRWTSGEIVRDNHVVTSPPNRLVQIVEVGLYTPDAAGYFQNFGRQILPLR